MQSNGKISDLTNPSPRVLTLHISISPLYGQVLRRLTSSASLFAFYCLWCPVALFRRSLLGTKTVSFSRETLQMRCYAKVSRRRYGPRKKRDTDRDEMPGLYLDVFSVRTPVIKVTEACPGGLSPNPVQSRISRSCRRRCFPGEHPGRPASEAQTGSSVPDRTYSTRCLRVRGDL